MQPTPYSPAPLMEPLQVPIYRRTARRSSAISDTARATDGEPKIIEMRLDDLRTAVRHNQVSFPSQIPVFEKHDRADLQPKLVQLFFVRGWSSRRIAARYQMLHQRVLQVLNTWRRRAIEMGYIQHIPPPHVPGTLWKAPIAVILSPVRPPLPHPAEESLTESSRVIEFKHALSQPAAEILKHNRSTAALQSLRSENTRLRALVAQLNANNSALMSLITKSDRA